MGGLIGLCTPDGGPCGGSPDDDQDSRRRNTDRKPIIDDESSTDSLSGTVRIRPGSMPKIDLAGMRVICPPIIVKNILSEDKFIKIRQKMEENTKDKYNDIEEITFQTDCWLIKGTDSISLEKYRDLFEIVIWRVPIIPAFSHFQNEQELYDKLNNLKQIMDLDTKCQGIWALLSKENFIQTFDKTLLTEIDIATDQYLADDDKFPSGSEEYQQLIQKLKKIDVMKKANEIIIIGQQQCAKDILRIIRQREVIHPSMIGMYGIGAASLPWEIPYDDPEAPDPNLITSHYCIVSNIPLNGTQDQLENVLFKYERWTYGTIMKQDDLEKKNNDIVDSGDDDDDKKQPDYGYLFAKIEFDDEKALVTFVDDVNKDLIYIGGNKLKLKREEKEMRKRKRRRLYAGHMIV